MFFQKLAARRCFSLFCWCVFFDPKYREKKKEPPQISQTQNPQEHPNVDFRYFGLGCYITQPEPNNLIHPPSLPPGTGKRLVDRKSLKRLTPEMRQNITRSLRDDSDWHPQVQQEVWHSWMPLLEVCQGRFCIAQFSVSAWDIFEREKKIPNSKKNAIPTKNTQRCIIQ